MSKSHDPAYERSEAEKRRQLEAWLQAARFAQTRPLDSAR